MRAIQVHEVGGPEVMKVAEVPSPTPGPGEARVRVAASGVNFIDIYYRTGAYKGALPFTPGMEGAGVVEAVGPEVTGVAVGDRVAWAMQLGSYAEEAIVPAGKLIPVPNSVELPTAAAAMLQGMTAHYLVTSTYPLKRGDTALVHAAAGGVGLLLIQMAKEIGARVIGTVSTEEKAALARAAGADEVILYSQEDFLPAVRERTESKGVDVVYDSVGKDTFDRSLQALRPRGMLVLFGQSSGAVEPLDPQRLNAGGSLFLTRPSLGHYIATAEELRSRAGDVFRWMAEGKLDVRIGESHPLEQAGVAHERLAGRATTGKVILTTR